MKLIKLVLEGKTIAFSALVFLGLFSGAIHVVLLIYINNALTHLFVRGYINDVFIYSTSALLVGYLVVNRIFSGYLILFSHKTIHNLRMRLLKAALKSDYFYMKDNSTSFFSAINKDAVIISQSTVAAIHLVSAIVTIIGCLGYLAYLSFILFFFIFSVSTLGIVIYTLVSSKHDKFIEKARGSEDILFYNIRQFIDGFKEIKINLNKGIQLINGPIQENSIESYRSTGKGITGYYNSGLFSNFLFYGALVLIIFVGSSKLNIATTVLMNCVILFLYILGPLETSTAIVPELIRGNIAAARLMQMVYDFKSNNESDDNQPLLLADSFRSLEFQNLTYTYPRRRESIEDLFSVGPINFELKKGEVAFIYGGNGSGKTTFINLFLGLFNQEKGSVLLNGRAVTAVVELRAIFAPVFADFHLFDTLYGVQDIEADRVRKYLKLFELDEKISFDGDKFSTINLSTGQRKRLALISILLENRPVLVLDEWAADQDPGFRNKFYTEVIPSLKQEGFAILAITHDDRYYQVADSLYKMEYGKLIKEEVLTSPLDVC